MSPPELTTKHHAWPGLARCSEKLLFPLPAPHAAFCGSLFRNLGRTDGINRLVVAKWLSHFWEMLHLSLCWIYTRDAQKSLLCQECQEQFALQSAVNLRVCSASGKAPQQRRLEPAHGEFPASPGLSSNPASVLWEHTGMRPKPPAIYHLCGCGIEAGEKGEAHIRSYKYHFVFPFFFSSTLLPSPPSNPLLFFSVADGGGKIPGGQDKLLNVVISNGSSWKLLTDAGPEIRIAAAASVRLGASHWFPFLIVKSKSMVTLQAGTVRRFSQSFSLSPHLPSLFLFPFPLPQTLPFILHFIILIHNFSVSSSPPPFLPSLFLFAVYYRTLWKLAQLQLRKRKVQEFDWCGKFLFFLEPLIHRTAYLCLRIIDGQSQRGRWDGGSFGIEVSQCLAEGDGGKLPA